MLGIETLYELRARINERRDRARFFPKMWSSYLRVASIVIGIAIVAVII